MVELLHVVAYRSELAARLEARTEEMVDSISSMLFARLHAFEQLGHADQVDAFRAGLRRLAQGFIRFVADGTRLTEAELAAFNLTGTQRARQGLSMRAVDDSIDIAMEVLWRFVRDAVEVAGVPAIAARVVAELAMETPPFTGELRDALRAGYTAEREEGDLGRAHAIADLVSTLVDGKWDSRSQIERTARSLGVEVAEPMGVMVVACTDPLGTDDHEAAARQVAARIPLALVGRTRTKFQHHVVVLVPGADIGSLRSHAKASPVADHLTVLIDETLRDWSDIPESVAALLAEIPSALTLAPMSSVVTTRDTELLRLLRAVPLEARVDFMRRVLGPILDLPPGKASDALATMHGYFRGRTAGRVDETAADLQLHRNSFRYRLERTQALLGVNFRDASDRLKVEVALWLHELGRQELALFRAERDGRPLA
jgi:hypothetical protein